LSDRSGTEATICQLSLGQPKRDRCQMIYQTFRPVSRIVWQSLTIRLQLPAARQTETSCRTNSTPGWADDSSDAPRWCC